MIFCFSQDGEDDPKCFSEDLDVLLGCPLAFKVRVQPNNRSSSVMKTSSNPETIACIRSKLETKMVSHLLQSFKFDTVKVINDVLVDMQIKESSGEGTCDSSSEANSKVGLQTENVEHLIFQ